MPHVPRLTPVGYLVQSVVSPDPDAVQVLRCGDCGGLVDDGEGKRVHLLWHRAQDGGIGDASARPVGAGRAW